MPDTRSDGGAPLPWLVLTAVATTAVLVLTLPRQLFDTNFYSLWEATNLLAGDHPYRDFFEWGIPLQAVLSAAAQRLVGNRMIGEFVLIHWTFIIAGAVISFDLGYRLTRSLAATSFMAVLALAVLPDTPTFHYPKLFLYPATVWLAWRYMDRPGVALAGALGLLTAVAFLFRHDHGVYIGVASVLACALARAAVPRRTWRQTLRDTAAYTLVAAGVLLPWMVLVQTSEGLTGYVRSRSQLYGMWAGKSAYEQVLRRNPLAEIAERWNPPPPKPGIITFRWADGLTLDAQRGLEKRYGLRRLDDPDGDRRWRYEVDNVDDTTLRDLKTLTESTEGLDWDRLDRLGSWMPKLEPSRLWLAQITMVVPLLLMLSAGFMLAGSRRPGSTPPREALRLLLAGALLTLVDAKLLREVSYAHLVAPLTAAMGAYYLRIPAQLRAADVARLLAAWVVLAVTGITALACMEPVAILGNENRSNILPTLDKMLLGSPIDSSITRNHAERIMTERSRDEWLQGKVGEWVEILMRYMHDCTAEGDRVLVTGSTPFQVGYWVQRPVAGGHLFWHHGWLTDAEHEARVLALLRRQSVPFAFSTTEPVLRDLEPYPNVHRYFAANYAPLPGSHDLLLIDRRRMATGTFGPYGFPCFK